MSVVDAGVRVDYFHDAPDDLLDKMGVDRHQLPDRDAWLERHCEDLSGPIEHRKMCGVIWELDGRTIGFSTADRIVYGEEAFMHLHITDSDLRAHGHGVEFVKLSAAHYFTVLRLRRLYSEPQALNIAPNRTLQRAGFQYVLSHSTRPGPINREQLATRWVIEHPPAV